jgi:hypothetical protein
MNDFIVNEGDLFDVDCGTVMLYADNAMYICECSPGPAVFLGKTRQLGPGWEAKVLTKEGTGWVWLSVLHCAGVPRYKQDAAFQHFSIHDVTTP